MTTHLSPLALTMGDPAGIGPEITVKAWTALKERGPAFCVIGPAALYAQTAAALGLSVPVQVIDDPADASDAFTTALPVLDRPLGAAATPGQPHRDHAPAVTGSIETAVALVRSGAVSGVVTNPITKAALTGAGFTFPGHTEFLAHLCTAQGAPAPHPVMMLAAPGLRVVPLTIHEPLSRVPSLITRERIVRTGRIIADALAHDFGIADPRIAVAGLNPHAGEAGTIGSEDRDIIAPAIADLCASGIDARGPLSADTLFHARARTAYDAALCMYHDQALIPIKTLDFDRGVNVTLGLPLVRTSPDHGTAHDIAGQGVAQADNLIAALVLAQDLAATRARASGLAR